MVTLVLRLEDLRDEGQEKECPGSIDKEGGHPPYLQAQWYHMCVGGGWGA